MKLLNRLMLIVICQLILTLGANGQIASGNFKIDAGGAVAGGGGAAGASSSIIGSVPLTAAGISGSSSYNMAGGIIAAAFKGTLTLNNPPVAACPGDTVIGMCALGEVCLPGFLCTDPDDNLDSCLVSLGTHSGDTVCFTPADTGEYTIVLIAKDKLGLADTCKTKVRIALNSPPVASCPPNKSVFACNLSSICVPGFTTTDVDGNISTREIVGGTMKGDTACFTPVSGENTVTFIATDSCGAADTCNTKITVNANREPVASSPPDSSMVVWSLADTICLAGFGWSDPDNNIASVQVRSGTLKGNSMCFAPVTGVNSLWLKVTDSCGASDTTLTKATISSAYSHNQLDTVLGDGETVKIAYGGGTVEGTFYYRLGGQSNFSSAGMIQGAADTLIYPIPAGLLTARGLEYYFTIIKGTKTINIGTAANPYQFVTQLTNSQAQRPAVMPGASYRIVSVPISISGSRGVQYVFGDDLGAYDKKQWRLASYNNNTNTYVEYPNSADVTPGQGFWLIARGAKRYGAAGNSILPNRIVGNVPYFQVALDSGWNQLGNPLPFDIDWTQVIFEDNGNVVTGHPAELLDDAAYWYSGKAYTPATNLPAWDGFFVNIKKRNVKALFPYQESSRGANVRMASEINAAKAASLDWYVDFSLEAGGYCDEQNYAGVKSDASDGIDRYDMGEPPPAPDGAYLAFAHPVDGSGRLRADIRSISGDGFKWKIILGERLKRSLRASNVASIPKDLDAWLVFDNGAEFKLTGDQSINIPDEVRSANFLIGNTRFMKSEGIKAIPSDYSLSQNYPNPFNLSTTIRFALPVSGHVDLEIFNILGQRIKLLISEDMAAGYLEADWNGCDESGKPVASGVYFTRLKSGEYLGYRKMMLLK